MAAVEGLSELKENIAKVIDQAKAPAMMNAYVDGARILLDQFQATAPVKTGRLRRSASVAAGDPGTPAAAFAIDQSIAPHWRFVEYGTSRTRPQFTIRNAVTTTTPRIARLLSDRFLEAVDRVLK